MYSDSEFSFLLIRTFFQIAPDTWNNSQDAVISTRVQLGTGSFFTGQIHSTNCDSYLSKIISQSLEENIYIRKNYRS